MTAGHRGGNPPGQGANGARANKGAEARAKARRQRQKRDKCKTPCDPKKVKDRYGSPPESLKKKMNAAPPQPKSCPICSKSAPFRISETNPGIYTAMTPDHIFPATEIMKKPGFCCLSDKNKQKVLNNPNNLSLQCRSCNTSRKNTAWSKWTGHSSGSVSPAGKKFIQDMATKSPGLSKNLGAQITRLF